MKNNKMIYKSKNGYTGTFSPGFFPGIRQHYDLSIFNTESGELVYHATYARTITMAELIEQVETFPDFISKLK